MVHKPLLYAEYIMGHINGNEIDLFELIINRGHLLELSEMQQPIKYDVSKLKCFRIIGS